MPTQTRQDWVDIAKGIGILLVVYGHTARGVVSAGMDASHGVLRLVDSIVYTFHMPLFLFLSGLFFCASLKKRGANASYTELPNANHNAWDPAYGNEELIKWMLSQRRR